MGSKTKHHFIPACYLAGFTEDEDRKSSFWCIPKNNTKPYGTNPNDACVQNKYYTVDDESDNPLLVEDWYAESIEPKIAEALQHIRNNRTLPNQDKMESLLLLVATIYLRNPRHRNSLAEPIERTAEIYMSMIADSQSLYKGTANKALTNGYISEIPEHDVIRDAVENGTVTPKANKEFLIGSEIRMINHVLDLLSHRYWQLYTIPDGADLEFVTSDHPFTLTHPEAKQYSIFGLGTVGTEISVPVNKKSVLVGTLHEISEGSFKANKHIVGLTNYKIVSSCSNVFYSSREIVSFSDGGSDYWEVNIRNVKSKDDGR